MSETYSLLLTPQREGPFQNASSVLASGSASSGTVHPLESRSKRLQPPSFPDLGPLLLPLQCLPTDGPLSLALPRHAPRTCPSSTPVLQHAVHFLTFFTPWPRSHLMCQPLWLKERFTCSVPLFSAPCTLLHVFSLYLSPSKRVRYSLYLFNRLPETV